MLSLSGYLRRVARNAILDGVEDALRYLEPCPHHHDVPSRMAEQLADRLDRLQQQRPAAAISGSSTQKGNPPEEEPHEPQKPVPHPKPESNGQLPAPKKERAEPPRKRGPGRPKKHPHPHAH